MATLELPRGPAASFQEHTQRGVEPRNTLHALESSRFPNVPMHLPKTRSSNSRQDYSAENLLARINSVNNLNRASLPSIPQWQESNSAQYDEFDEGEMEEILEELQDDEIEEMADTRNPFNESGTQDLIGDSLDTIPLLDSAQSICITSIQSILRIMLASATHSHSQFLERSDAADMLSKSVEAIPMSGTLSLDVQARHEHIEWMRSLEPLFTNLEQVSPRIPGTDGDLMNDSRIATSLQNLAISIQAAREQAEWLDDCFLEQQGNRTSRQSTTSSPMISSSPSISRKELRNPFNDAAGSQSITFEDRNPTRNDGETENLARVMKILHAMDKRCVAVIANLETTLQTREHKKALQETWSQLQIQSKKAQDLIASRQSLNITLGASKGSHSPLTHSPAYSPSHGRSRRNSNTSLQSLPTSLHSAEGGDPVGEATVAGVGVGISRNLARMSSLSSRGGGSSITIGHLSPSSSSLAGLPAVRRESTKSDATAPPRYSEESARRWTENVYGSNREAVEMGHQRREREGSGGNMSDVSVKTLPDYNSSDFIYQKMNNSSNSSLNKLDQSTNWCRDEKKSDNNTKTTTQSTLSTTTTVDDYPARTSHDLRMVETSIERLYSAVPQLDNQRVSSPLESKRRYSQDVLQLIEQMTKSGRMEDQRAVPNLEIPQRNMSSPPETHSADTVIHDRPLSALSSSTRLGKRLGSISLKRSLSSRIASSVLGSDVKGKEREKSASTPEDSITPTLEDLSFLANQVQAASERGFKDQRAFARAKTVHNKKTTSKMERMDIDTLNQSAEQDDVDFLDILSASMSSNRRMMNQDAPLRSSCAKQMPSSTDKSFALSSYTPTGRSHEQIYPVTTSHTPSNPYSGFKDGECVGLKSSWSSENADSSNRGVGTENGVKTSYKSNEDASLHYISESQPRLGIISAQFWERVKKPSTGYLAHCIDGNSSKVIKILYRQAESLFLLPAPAMEDQEGQTLVVSEDYWQMKLRMADPLLKDSFEGNLPLSASALQKDLPIAFVCDTCQSVFADTETIKQYLPLPSQHWEELIDAWMCHSDQILNQGLIDTQKKLDEHHGLQRGQGRVSDERIIIHASHIAKDATFREEISRMIHCSKCKSSLGQVTTSSDAIELFKFAIRPRWISRSLSSSILGIVVANDLIRTSQAHATRHFLLLDNDMTAYLHLWLFLESCQIAVSLPTSFHLCSLEEEEEEDHRGKTQSVSFSACKIMYRKATCADRQASSAWTQPDLVEQIQYPKEVCIQLQHLLDESNLCYPPSRRQFTADWNIGFLQTNTIISTM